jgi:hypothetical protein
MAFTSARHPSARHLESRRDHEIDLVEGAIALVASGGARRASLVVQEGDAILAQARAAAIRHGVSVRAIVRPGGGCDLIVEPMS